MKLFLVAIIFLVIQAKAAYNMTHSVILNTFSGITHCSRELIQSWSCKACKTTPRFIDVAYLKDRETNIAVYLGYLPDYGSILVAWRGTEPSSIINWAEDLDFNLLEYPRCKGCRVHEGFFESYKFIASSFHQVLGKMTQKYPNSQIIFTGSSMGAALATISALESQLKYFGRVEQLHVYGSPRVGNAAFSLYLQKKVQNVYRVVHNRDLVPHVPLMSQEYHHVAVEIFFNEAMEKFKICDSTGEDFTCSDQFTLKELSVEDHLTYWTQPIKEDICTP